MQDFYSLIRPAVHAIPAEKAHNAAILALRSGLLPGSSCDTPASLQNTVLGMDFKSPLGLAAGFDKNAEVVDAVLKQGFAFAEAGTVTPKPQPGNPMPRLFRLPEDRAVINRLGFNNKGLHYFCRQLARRNAALGIAGANIGKNKDSEDAVADYMAAMQAVYPYADYITINISSPNTKGLRDLQKSDALYGLLSSLMNTRKGLAAAHKKKLPLLLKIAPDLTEYELKDIVSAVMQLGVDAMIVSNTTITRPDHLRSEHAAEQGGLSGAPLFEKSTALLAKAYKLSEGKLPLIGVGGISCADTAYAKIGAGASLLQLYSALVYEGFGLVRRIEQGLDERLKRDGFTSVAQAVGADVN